jgi:CheY-like chemotaxis protein
MESELKAAQTILVVDDEPAVRQLIGRILELNGYAATLAASAPEALEILKRNDTEIGLVLTDVVMPGMDGAQLAARISAMRPEIPMLFVTAYCGKSSREMENLGYIEKPFKPDDLLRRVRRALASSGSAAKNKVPANKVPARRE